MIYNNLSTDEIGQLEFQAGKKATELIDNILGDNKEIKSAITYVTPEMYGAKGDGTTDDTAAIQSAINSGVTKIVFKKATYKVASRLSFHSDINMVGEKGTKLIFDVMTGDSALMSGQDLSNITIENITFDFNDQEVLRYSISLIDSEHITVRNCTFEGGYGYAWRINNDVDVLFEGCAFNDITGSTGNPGGAIYGSDFHDVSVLNCSCDTIDDHFVYVAGAVECYNVFVRGCTFIKTGSNGLTNGAAVCVYANSHDVIIDGNIFKQCRMGIYVGKYGDYTTAPHDVTISDNIIRNVTLDGIHVEGLSAAPVVQVHISGNTIYYASQDGISIGYTNYAVVDSNSVDYPSRYGIVLDRVYYSTFTGGIITNVANTALLVGSASSPCLYCKFDNIIMTQKSGAYTSTGLHSRQANYCEYTNVKAVSFETNYIYGGGAFNSYVNTQEVAETKSIYFTSDITKSHYHNIGDVEIASNPTAGQPVIWVCTVAGSPGTMTPIVTLP